MIKPVVITVIALLVGAIVGKNWIGSDSSNISSASLDLKQRLEILEQRLEQETLAREKLEQIVQTEKLLLADLSSQISEFHDDYQNSIANSSRNFDRPIPAGSFADAYEIQINALTEAGFSQEEAQRIADLEAEIQQTILTARFENRSINPRDLVLDFQNTLRSELGDDQYALYLETKGRPTNVEVMEVMESSAGKIAGLENGDKIISYDGERVFSILDLQRLTQEGTEGQTVVMEIDRDGIPVTLAIPRGQIGISSGDFGFRNRRNN